MIMDGIVFVPTECETVDVKEECVDEEDPLLTTPVTPTGSNKMCN